jgi:hypothetical protein
MNTPAQQPRDFASLFGSGRPEDWEGFEEAVEGWRNEARAELEMWRDGNILHEIHRDELEKVERERDHWKSESLEQATLLAMSANREERLAQERDEARMQYRTTELLGMALVKTIDQLKAEKAAIFAQLVSLQAGSRRATLDEIAESVREKYDERHEGEGMENE